MVKASIVGNHPSLIKSIESARVMANHDSPALVVGESGTGKKTFCRLIHQNSKRNASAFHIVDCQQDPQKVENSILGYREESGKFVRGVLELSNGGTVVLENIDNLDEKFQKKLFRIMNELQDYDLDIRFLATTTKNLSKFVGSGRFHRSLYTYFSKETMSLSPLREREGDVTDLAHHFLNVFSEQFKLNSVTFSEEAIEKLNGYYWSRNIKELQMVLENAIKNHNNGVVDVDAIKLGERKADSSNDEMEDLGIRLMSLREAERLLIQKALVHTSENRTQAAKILGVSIRTLRNKINEYRGQGQSYFVNLR